MAPVMDGPLEVFAELMGHERRRAESRDAKRVAELGGRRRREKTQEGEGKKKERILY